MTHRMFTLCLLVAGSFLVTGVAQSATCSSVTFERHDARPLGTCRHDGDSCDEDIDCSNGSDKDYCVKGMCEDDSSEFCVVDGDCTTGSCLEDITFTFTETLTCGTFVNGDHWVEAPSGGTVTISSMTPDHTTACETSGLTGCRNGWDTDVEHLSLRLTSRGFKSHGVDSLPKTFTPGTSPVSVMKSIDGGRIDGDDACDVQADPRTGGFCGAILHAAVLTIVPNGDTPPANAFRPPFSGPDKPSSYYRTSSIIKYRMPNMDADDLTDDTLLPSWDDAEEFFHGPAIGINRRNSETNGYLAMNQGYQSYHRERSKHTNDIYLRLLFDNNYTDTAQHKTVLYGAVQAGIDKSWMLRNWVDNSTPGKRIKNMAMPIMFAAMVLGDDDLSDTGYPNMSEQDTFYDSPKHAAGTAGHYLWGYNCSESIYWDRTSGGTKAKDKWCADPYGHSEGTLLPYSGSYQQAASMGPWRGGSLIIQLMRLQPMLDVTAYLHVMGRFWDGWDSDSTLSQGHVVGSSDTCEKEGGANSANASDCHDDNSCTCITGTPYRNPDIHNKLSSYGTAPGVVSGTSALATDVWDTYRSCAAVIDGDGVTSTTYPCTGMADTCPWDINTDGAVGWDDVATVTAKLAVSPCTTGSCPWDINRDGAVGADDLSATVANVGACP